MLVPSGVAAQDWERHVIDQQAGENIGEYCAMAISGSRIVVAYYFDGTGVQGYLKMADFDGTTWTLSTIDDEDLSDGEEVSIAIDPTDGHPAVVYEAYAGTNRYLKYAKHDGVDWEREPIPLPGGVTNAAGAPGRGLSFTSDGVAQVVWFSSGTWDLYVSSLEGGSWSTEPVASDGNLGPAASLIHDSVDGPWIVCSLNNGSLDKLLAAHNDGGWSFGEVYGPSNGAGEYNALAYYAPTGQLISSFKEGAYIRTYEYDDGTDSWTRFGTATPPGNQGLNLHNACAFDASGTFAVAHYNEYDHSLRYAYWTGSSWHRAIVDDAYDVSQYYNLSFYNETVAVIACYDADEEALVVYANGELSGGSGSVTPWDAASLLTLTALPNPFGSATGCPASDIHFTLATGGVVSLRVQDATGRLVRNLLVEQQRAAGPHRMSWNGKDGDGNPLPSGAYFYSLTLDGRMIGRRALLLR